MKKVIIILAIIAIIVIANIVIINVANQDNENGQTASTHVNTNINRTENLAGTNATEGIN